MVLYIHDHFDDTANRLNSWLTEARQGRGIVLEIGAGFNTPTVIRTPGEQLVYSTPNWKLIRINLMDADVPTQLGARALSLKGDATDIASLLAIT